MPEDKINIGLLLGDPSGIGPELISKLLTEKITDAVNIVVIGEKNILDKGDQITGNNNNLKIVNNFDEINFSEGNKFFLDISKGIIPILITKEYFTDLIYVSSLAALLGHIFPVWLRFKGGKGVATYLGIIFILSFNLGVIFCVSWILISIALKYSSLSQENLHFYKNNHISIYL